MSSSRVKAVAAGERTVYSVSELNRRVKALLEQSFPTLWIEGELSNFSRPRSGHWYFTLKDADAQVRCAMFAGRNRLLEFRPEDGQQVLVRARVALYEPRGDYQLIVEFLEEAGDGALRRAFEALKKRLHAEGLLDSSRKRPLPPAPRCIGIITSPTGAALRDILSVLRRRYPLGRVVLYGVPVQGDQAAPAIVRALHTVARRGDCDVLVLARGGGSLEDLWPFNDEAVARAIADCPVPVVSGVGHEIDFTIADFVADARAPTPSAAAELVSPDLFDQLARVRQLGQRALHQVRARSAQVQLRLSGLDGRLQRQQPGRRLEQSAQRLDELDTRLRRGFQRLHTHAHTHLDATLGRLMRAAPRPAVQAWQQRLDYLHRRLRASAREGLQQRRGRLDLALRTLHSVSPEATLERGYAIATLPDRAGSPVLRDAARARHGERVALRLHRGRLMTRVSGDGQPSRGEPPDPTTER